MPAPATKPARKKAAPKSAARARPAKGPAPRPVIVCTEYRGVFFGYAADTSGDRVHLKGARMAIKWGTTRGVMELAHTGPTTSSLIGAPADSDIRRVSAVFEVTPEALRAREKVK